MRAAVLCLAFILVGLIALIFAGSRVNPMNMTPAPYSPEVLAQKARDMIKQFGYSDPPADSAYGFDVNTGFAGWAERNLKPEEYRALVAKGEIPYIYFWYRKVLVRWKH